MIFREKIGAALWILPACVSLGWTLGELARFVFGVPASPTGLNVILIWGMLLIAKVGQRIATGRWWSK